MAITNFGETSPDVRKILTLLSCCLVLDAATAQQPAFNPYYPPASYRSPSNPYYWKNRKPFDGYWQQDVAYTIAANFDERTGIISGAETLTYYNNSPDTLPYVFFHLYEQAFVKGGHIEALNRANNVKQTFGKYESNGLGEVVESIKVNGIELKHTNDFSVMKVFLTHPLMPDDSVTFSIRFKTYFDNGSQRRRMKKFSVKGGFTQYDGVHWYPRICVYDRKFGWDTDQHLGKEFYGDFGSFDVRLTVANNMIVGATGTLLNEDEVLPDSLRQKLDLRNFARKPWESAPSVVIPYDSTIKKTWHFFAENVHDFAWTADPTYRIGEYQLAIYDPVLNIKRNILCQALAQERHAAGWQDAAEFTAGLIATYSLDFGTYSWNKIIVADAQDGMEYPMLTLDGGFSPTYYDLLAHEVGHMWFFGQVGNNETYRAALDEGFTQFIESWSMKKLIGDTMPVGQLKSAYTRRYYRPRLVTDARVYLPYLADAAKGTDESINQHSDAFNGALGHGGGYRQVYFKTATMLWNLQYVLGDSLFNEAMKHYFAQWKICHPYFDDFRNSIIQFTHVDLNWFFDEWMESTKTIDYAVKKVKAPLRDSSEIILKRKGRSQMPVDLQVTAKDGKQYDYYIPNTWYDKRTPATTLPKWYGWDNLHDTYSFRVAIPSGIRQVTIDPTNRLADVYMPDNRWKHESVWHFDSQVANAPDWKKYEVNWRPDLWYNAVDGLKIGLHLDGDYFGLKNKFSLTAWWNSFVGTNAPYHYFNAAPGHFGLSPVSFNFSYSSNTHRFIRNSSVDFGLKYLDGTVGGNASFSIQANANNLVSAGAKAIEHPQNQVIYALHPNLWSILSWNNYVFLNWEHSYRYFTGNGQWNLQLRSSSLFSDYHYADITLTQINRTRLGKLDLNTRLIARSGKGDYASESQLYLAGASPEELLDNKYTRSIGFVPAEWLGYGIDVNHFQYGGGLNLRGYAGYLAPEWVEKDSITYMGYVGNSGAAINAELDYDRLIKLRPKLFKDWLHIDGYLFADAGSLAIVTQRSYFHFDDLHADAGLGFAFTIKSWGPLDKVKPLTLRADFPLLLNRIPQAESDYFAFRWVIGLNRSF